MWALLLFRLLGGTLIHRPEMSKSAVSRENCKERIVNNLYATMPAAPLTTMFNLCVNCYVIELNNPFNLIWIKSHKIHCSI